MTLAESDPLFMWTVYDHPRDFPNSFVARLWRIEAGKTTPTDTIMVFPTLKMIRERMMDAGLTRIRRFEHDDPNIVEVWT
jgi:hypothetical protein